MRDVQRGTHTFVHDPKGCRYAMRQVMQRAPCLPMRHQGPGGAPSVLRIPYPLGNAPPPLQVYTLRPGSVAPRRKRASTRPFPCPRPCFVALLHGPIQTNASCSGASAVPPAFSYCSPPAWVQHLRNQRWASDLPLHEAQERSPV